MSVGDEGNGVGGVVKGGGRTVKETMFSLCLSCAAGHFCFLLVSINRCSQQTAAEGGEGGVGSGGGGGGVGVVPDADHL